MATGCRLLPARPWRSVAAVAEWVVRPSPEEAAQATARLVADAARAAIATRGRCEVAVSGGSTPMRMLAALGQLQIAWEHVVIHQVDERVAPAGDPARNVTSLLAALPARAHVRPMPVESADLDTAALEYAAGLPARFDVIHLGIGDDGHTASLVPGDAVLDVADRDVAITGTYRGHRRMTLTLPVLDRARRVLWLATGADKRGPLALLRAGDPSIPASRVRALDQVVVCDAAAAP
jgi:6-phosphogluconolactonase